MLTQQGANIENLWQDVLDRAATTLRRKGVPAAAAEDAVQEAVARAIARSVPFDDADDLLRWIHTVAWRVVLDVRKRDRRLVYAETDTAATDDTARAAEARISLEQVRSLMRKLTPDELAALQPRTTTDRRESVRWAVRRHRARLRLLALLEGVAAVVVVPRLQVSRQLRMRTAAVAAVAPLAAASLSALWSVEVEPRPPSRSGPIAERVATPPQPPFAAPVHAQVARQTPALAGSPSVQPTRLRVEVNHPADGGGWIRPKDPDDALVCVRGFVLLGDRCVDLPVQITD